MYLLWDTKGVYNIFLLEIKLLPSKNPKFLPTNGYDIVYIEIVVQNILK